MAVPNRQQPAAQPVRSPENMAAMFEPAKPASITRANLLPTAPNFPFFLMHWSEEWAVETAGLDEPTWLPNLARHNVIPGVNLNRTLRKEDPPEAAYDLAVLTNQRKGAVYMFWGQFDYLVAADCEDPRTGTRGKFWQESWMKPRAARRGKRLKFRPDRAVMNRFRHELVLSGHIRPPDDDVLEVIRERARQKLIRVSSLTGLEPKELKRRTDKAKSALNLLAAAAVPEARVMVEQAGAAS